MKLVDILARELKVWPVEEGDFSNLSDYCVQSDESRQIFFCGIHDPIFLSLRADKTSGVRVTRAEWQAAVDALNAPKVVVWNEGGLPPVGVDCEVENEVLGGWDRAEKILAHSSINGKDVAVFQRGDLIAYARAGSFRPIRTPEQIAEEELQIATQAIMVDAGITDSALKDDPEAWVWAAALHMAGYRKQVEP